MPKAKPEPTQTKEDPEFVSPTREPDRIPDIDIHEEAKRIFGDDLVDPDERQADVEAMVDGIIAEHGGALRSLSSPRGLHAKLAEIMGVAGRIPKNGTAPPGMGSYKFVQVGDAADVIRKELAARGITMMPHDIELIGEMGGSPFVESTTRNGGTMTTLTIRTVWRLTDSETGEFYDLPSLGTGADSGDKFSPKAQTNAMKYALLMGFLLSTGDDPEASDLSEPTQGPGISINASNVQGVLQGGRQTKATSPQMDAIKKQARRLDIEPESFAVLIGSILGGKAPELDSKEATVDQQRAILAFCGELEFAEAGELIRGLEETPSGDDRADEALGPEDVGAK